jgi:hypothetical protein
LSIILLPEELQKVDKTLRAIGLGKLADEGIKALNRAAEDAVSEATPIFVDAVKQITFNDVRTILLGTDNAATQYLEGKTNTALYNKFNPVIKNSFAKVGADKIWTNLITKYNDLPLTNNVNPDLTDYVTQQALQGVYTTIAVEEKEIRTKTQSRTTDLLNLVFEPTVFILDQLVFGDSFYTLNVKKIFQPKCYNYIKIKQLM